MSCLVDTNVLIEFPSLNSQLRRIAALMLAHGVTHILTLNPTDFARYSGITAVTPQEILGQ